MSASLLKLGTSVVSKEALLKEAKAIAQLIFEKVPDVCDVYFFGSAFNGVFTVNSDIDLIVVLKDNQDFKINYKKLYTQRWTTYPLDLIAVSKNDFEQKKDLGGVCFTAFHEGLKIL